MLNSLKNKVLLSIIIVVVVGTFVSALAVILTVRYQMSGKYTIEKEASIESLSLALAEEVNDGSFDQIERTVKSALVYENIAYVAVFDADGKLIGSATEPETETEDLDLSIHGLSVGGTRVGTFQVGFSGEYIDNLVTRTGLVLIIVLAGFLILTGLGLYFFMRRSIISPIRDFTRTVEGINADNLSGRVRVQTGDELGFLARAFNNMTQNLEKSQDALKRSRDELEERVEQRTRGERRRAEQLRTINEFSRRISSILSLDELLPYVVESLQQTFDYYNVNIFLAEGDAGSLELKAGAGGYKKDVPLGFTIPPDEGVIGAVFRSGEPLNIPDVAGENRYIPYENLPDTRAELAVPVKLADEIFGVLDVESREKDAFDEIDVFTLQTLGDQLAVAIENSRLYRETRELAVISERNRLAREIHDTLAQGFTGIVLQLEAAEQAMAGDGEDSREHLEKAKQLARESLSEARRSVWALRPEVLEHTSLAETLRQETEKFGRDTGADSAFSLSGEEKNVGADTENALFRIFQESLNNVRKHAGAGKIDVTLSFDNGNVALSVQDDGKGFDTGSDMRDRFGLISMRERARLLGGSLEINSRPGEGTRLNVIIPLDRRDR